MISKRLISVILLLVLLFTACAKEPEMSEAERFYREFMEAYLEDQDAATIKYVHFEDERHLQLSLEADYDTYSYEILEVSQLSDQLWAIKVVVVDDPNPNGFEFFNFVGIIDGEYRVMRNIEQIPPDLKADIENIEDYQVQFETLPLEDIIEP